MEILIPKVLERTTAVDLVVRVEAVRIRAERQFPARRQLRIAGLRHLQIREGHHRSRAITPGLRVGGGDEGHADGPQGHGVEALDHGAEGGAGSLFGDAAIVLGLPQSIVLPPSQTHACAHTHLEI